METTKTIVSTVQQKRIEKACEEICEDCFTIAPIITRMRMRASYNVETLCVDEHGRGLYNPDFVKQYDSLQLKFLLLHEAYHVLLRHIKRLKKHIGDVEFKEYNKENPGFFYRWNIAGDSVINENLTISLPAGSVPIIEGEQEAGMVTYETITKLTGLPTERLEKMSTEEIYDALPEVKVITLSNGGGGMTQQGQQEDNSTSGNGSGSSGQNNSSKSDNGSNNGENQDDEQENKNGNGSENDQDQDDQDNNNGNGDQDDQDDGEDSNDGNGNGEGDGQDEDSKLNDYEEVQKEYGQASSQEEKQMEQAINDSHARSAGNGGSTKNGSIIDKSVVDQINLKESFDWKEILSSFIYKVSGKGESNRTWKRPSRRYRDVYPVSKGKSRRTGSKNVTFSIDVSGSMNYEKIIRSVSLLVDFAEEHNVNCEYFFFSSWTSKLYQYEGKQEFVDNLNKNYGGGTSMYAALGSEQLEDIDGLVIISDMEFYDHEAQQLADGEYEHVTFPVALINVEPNSNCRAAEILKQAFTDLDQYAEYK